MDNREKIPDLAGLADIFIPALKETKDSGNVVNRQTISKFLSRKKEIRDMVRLAKGRSRQSESHPEGLASFPESLLTEQTTPVSPDAEEWRRLLDQERDFQSDIGLFLLNLCYVPENELFYPFIEQYKGLLADDASLEKRKALLNSVFDSIRERGAMRQQNGTVGQGACPGDAVSPIAPDALKIVKDALHLALNDLQRVLGDKCRRKIRAITRKIKACEDLESLVLLREDVLGIIEYYISQVNSERIKVADFIKDVGKKLIGIENDLAHTFLDASQLVKEDTTFNAGLREDILGFRDNVQDSNDLNELKNIIFSRIESLTLRLEQKQREYNQRLETLALEKSKIQANMESMISLVLDQNKILMEHSQKDPLTGIMNRGMFEETFDFELHRFHRYKEPFALIMFDLDHFKVVNDTYGHEAGDRVLIGVAKSVSQILRASDVFARFGGEEFVVMMPYSDYSHGIVVAEKIRKTIEETQFLYESTQVPITVSVGLTVATLKDKNFKAMYKRVDNLLYEAKKTGKNKVATDIKLPLQEPDE